MNSFGQNLRLHIAGESHGPGIGIMVDGMPPGLAVDLPAMQARLDARRPGTSKLVSARQEADQVQIKSGVYEDKTTGAPVLLWIDNQDTRSKDYSELRRKPRPGHSDWVNNVWSNGHYDHRGGGHSSGRLTACLVAAAALVEPMLAQQGIRVASHLASAGDVAGDFNGNAEAMQTAVDDSPVYTATGLDAEMVAAIEAARNAKDSIGGQVQLQADGVPVAWGAPFFDSIESQLAHMLFAVPAVKGVEFGAGFAATQMTGSQHNDGYRLQAGKVAPASNHAGGILGGRSTGAPITGRVAIKPTSSIFQPQPTVDLESGEEATLELKGRHDPCIAIRAVPVVRACVELVLADFLLQARMEGHA